MAHRAGYAAIVGRPNVGKSTLLNALVGAKVAIVTPKPQTTRNRIIGIKTLPQAQLIFVDTPGIHRHPGSLLNQRMVEAALYILKETDVVLFLVDAQRGVVPADEEIGQRLSGARVPVVVVVNKLDLISRTALLPLLERLVTLLPERDIPTARVLTGETSAELLN